MSHQSKPCQRRLRQFYLALVAVATAAGAWPGGAQAAVSEGPARVDFDDRLVRGQRRGAGSVYIFQREKVELRSMVVRPRSFRQRIVATVFKD